jgi:iron complex outermembrane receptor protein
MSACLRSSAALALVLTSTAAVCAEPTAPIEKLTVTGTAVQTPTAQADPQEIGVIELQRRGALSAAEALELAGAANITVNSRGETLVYLRNAGERQTAVFFDGALLNQPWDNRLSLDLVPTNAVAGLTVSPGAVSLRHGVNSAGGAIELLPVGPDDRGARLDAALGAGELKAGAGRWVGVEGDVSLLLAAERLDRNALPGSGGADQTNTDLRRDSLVARAAWDGEDIAASLSLLHVDAAYGVAAEQFDRPSQGRPRFWRYPESRQTLAVGRLARRLGAVRLDASLWRQDGAQTIDSYASSAYAALEDRLAAQDDAWGLRAQLEHDLAGGAVRIGLSGLSARREESETAYDPAGPTVLRAEFSDRRSSLFAEYEGQAGSIDYLLGVSRDRLDPRKTGGRPDSGDFDGLNAVAALAFAPSEDWRLRVSASRKHRLPTLRELFGTALDRFAANPALEGERIDMAEASAVWSGERASFEITPFYSRVSGTIDQRNIILGGDTLRQRINLRSSTVWGVEARGEARLDEAWTLSGHVLASRPRRLREAGFAGPLLLSERPELIARLALDYAGPQGLEAGAELQHRGRAYSFTDEDVFEPLTRSTELNLRAAWAPEDSGWRLWARLDNATDEDVEPQLGLFAPGRSWRVGCGKKF